MRLRFIFDHATDFGFLFLSLRYYVHSTMQHAYNTPWSFYFSFKHTLTKKKKSTLRKCYVASDIYIVLNKTRMWECGHTHMHQRSGTKYHKTHMYDAVINVLKKLKKGQ